MKNDSDSVTPVPRSYVREHEILRLSAMLALEDTKAIEAARNEVLKWAQTKTVGKLPAEAWGHESFDHLSGGRNCSAVRLQSEGADIWAVRVEDPDKTVPGRIWTTEIAVASEGGGRGKFTLRLIVGSPEPTLSIEPHVPGVVLQLINSPGLFAGTFRLSSKPVVIRSDHFANLLIDALLNPSRKLPIIVLSVPSESSTAVKPLLDAPTLAKACAGLAVVAVLPSQFSWALTERFGKKLSVYQGAARVYLPGFTEDADPFGGHELLLPERFSSPSGAEASLTRLRWIAAKGSVRRLRLGVDVLPFAPLKTQELKNRQLELGKTGATVQEQLATSTQRIELLEAQVQEAVRWQDEFSRLHALAEERAETAESQLKARGFRIQQLLTQIRTSGEAPDARVVLPDDWSNFNDWCDDELAGRVDLTPQARRGTKSALFDDTQLAARCLQWLANDFREAKMGGTEGSLRDYYIEPGIINAHCGADRFEIEWQGKKWSVEWHIKNGGNTRDPKRCLRIYYFWDDSSQQAVIASMPAHLRTGAS